MAQSTVKAVTFDLWDTVFVDESDEPRRAAVGLLPKREERRHLVHQFLERHEPVERAVVDAACDTVDAAFGRVWYSENVTWTVRQRLEVLLKGLHRTLPEDELVELARLHEEMELMVPPDTAPGVAEALSAVAGKYKLGVVSDAVFSPGWALRKLLERAGLLDFFNAFAFSDEVGRAKPAPEMFEPICRELGVQADRIVHIGDREEKDVTGAHAVGARAILVTVVKDRGSAEKTRAEGVCDDYGKLVSILEELERG